jgi:phosphopantothenoylcysteine decarboxylase / phosphopantothenate---cysteine ligase
MISLKILITAGPTHEAIDPVRFISNHSTGYMGYAIARKAQRQGHKVTLISGPTYLKHPLKAKTITVCTAKQMFEQVKKHIKGKDCLIMAAAVSDFRPVARVKNKIKSTSMPAAIYLKKNPDILSWAGKNKGRIIIAGFCMETENLLKQAEEKRKKKNADFMIANKITQSGAPFGKGMTSVVVLDARQNTLRLDNKSKDKIAGILLEKIGKLWYKKHSVHNA